MCSTSRAVESHSEYPFHHTRFINPDAWTLDKLHKAGVAGFSSADPALLRRFFVEAANEVFSDVEQSIANLKSVGIETVLSTGKYRPVVEQARQRGMFVGLIYVALSSPSLAIERVANRVQQAGHDVPSDKIIERWYRSLAQLPWFARHASAFFVVDNSDSNPDLPPILAASGKHGVLEFLAEETFGELKVALEELPRK